MKHPVFVDDITGMGGITVANNLIFNCNIMEERKKMKFNNKNGKTEYMVIGRNKKEMEMITSKVKNGRIERVKEHKMLGTWFDETGDYGINIRKRKEKLPFMLATIKHQGSPTKVGVYAVEARLKLAQTVIIPSLLYNAEAFQQYKEKEIEELESIQLKILTSIFEVPSTTP